MQKKNVTRHSYKEYKHTRTWRKRERERERERERKREREMGERETIVEQDNAS